MASAPPPLRPDDGPARRTERPAGAAAFTLVETIVSMAVLVLLMVILVQMFAGISSAWTSNTGRAGAFVAARSAFEAMGRNLSQATLNTYLGYADAQGLPVPLINPSFKIPTNPAARSQVPTQYLRASELHFITDQAVNIFTKAGYTGTPANSLKTTGQAVFFQANAGFAVVPDNQPKQSLLNVLGYYLEFNKDTDFQSSATSGLARPRYRYRLMETIQPSEINGIYHSTNETDATTGLPKYTYDLDWVKTALTDYSTVPGQPPPASGQTTAAVSPRHPLAENVIALILWPKLSPLQGSTTTPAATPSPLTTDYSYDSRRWEDTARSGTDKRWRNQLPPIVTLTLVAIDEPSAIKMAQRYGGNGGAEPPLANAALSSALQMGTLFQNPDNLTDDLGKLGKGLAALRINYRVFQADVTMHGSQWSNQ